MNSREKEIISNLLNGGNGSNINSKSNSNQKDFEVIKKNVNGCNISIQIPLTESAKEQITTPDYGEMIEAMMDDKDPRKLECDNDEYLFKVKEQITEVVKDDPIITAFLQNPENKYYNIAFNLVLASLDNVELKTLMDYYHTSGLYNKFLGTGMYGPIAKYLKFLFTNILNVGKQGQIMALSMG